jgi:hypothetical protein
VVMIAEKAAQWIKDDSGAARGGALPVV